jgi:hypothetical protein
MILWGSSFLSFSQPVAGNTLSPAFAMGLKSYSCHLSRGSVYSPLFRKTPVILSRSFCRPSKFFDSKPGPGLPQAYARQIQLPIQPSNHGCFQKPAHTPSAHDLDHLGHQFGVAMLDKADLILCNAIVHSTITRLAIIPVTLPIVLIYIYFSVNDSGNL